MDISSLISQYAVMDYAYVLAIVIGSYIVGKIIAPMLIWVGTRFTERTKTTLDDHILAGIKGPIESFFFIILIELAINYMPSYFAVFNSSQIGLATDLALILFFTYLIYKIIHIVFRWYYEEGRKDSIVNVPVDLLPFFQKVTQIFLLGVAIIFCVSKLGIDVTALAALPLVITLVAGFAAQEIVSNMFYGLAMQMERNIRYGDYLKLPSGEVVRLKKIGLKTTKLLDLSGNPIMISNAEFAKTRITKLGEVGSQAKVSVPFEIDSRTDLAKLQEHVKKELGSAKEIVHGPDGISVTVSKYKQGWIEGSVNLTIEDLSVSGKASDIVTRAIKGFTGRKA